MKLWQVAVLGLPLVALAACGEVSFAQKVSPAKQFKDYKAENAKNAAVLGIGEPVSSRQMKADATVSVKGIYDIEQVMTKLAGTYNVAVRWGNGVRKGKRKDIIITNLGFNEARAYVEDVFDVQVIREGDRRLLVLPSASEPRLKSFKPGDNVSLSEALRGLADQCGYNLVITENKDQIANTRVSTSMKDVTCYDAFEALLNPYNMSLIQDGDYFTIGGLPQRQWNVPLLEPVRAEELEVTYTSDFTSASDSSGGSNSQNAGGSNKVTIKSERDLWKEMKENLEALIASNCPKVDGESDQMDQNQSQQGGANVNLLPPPTLTTLPQNQSVATSSASSTGISSGGDSDTTNRCGYVRINSTVGLVQMRAPLSVLNEADDIINRVQDIANRRIMLEARVLAVTKYRGFDQAGSLKLNKGDGYAGSSGSSTSITSALAGKLLGLQEAGGFLAVQTQSLDAIVRMLEEYGTTYELMHPMLELMDRQRATLIDGRNERYFVREIESQTSDTGQITRNLKATEKMQFVGLQFAASAQISGDENPHTIALQIPMTSVVKYADLKQVFDNEEIVDQIPVASTRLIDQKVRVRDGEIKVIGGLTKTIAVDRESGQPLLREVPAFGKLLGDETVSFEEVEFVVLLQVRKLL
ncbi:MAG: hypothetical protein WAZ18_00245 [Alphaproteobacteria bacterium]